MTKDFLIAGFRLRIDGSDWIEAFGHFGRALKVFETEFDPAAPAILKLHTDMAERPDFAAYKTLDEFDFPEVNADCRFAANEDGHLFTMTVKDSHTLWFHKQRDSADVTCNFMECLDIQEIGSLMRFGLWIAFGLAITPLQAIAIHSSTIRCRDGAVLFLGESGTGKSTHTRLWREHIPGAELLNDDSPIIRFDKDSVTVYGSPWSGKAPCYKQEGWPVRGMVRLSQAPHNRIHRLPVIQAIGALIPSCPPAFAFDNRLQDCICETLSRIIAHTPVYHLECLPDAAAARLSFETVYKSHAVDR